MMQQVTRFTSQIENKTSQWIVESDTPIEIAEKMCLEFLQNLGMIKAQQKAAQEQKNLSCADNASSNEDSKVEEIPHVES
jgi:benzoyl-CoA reductase/2-hydroxyglutaryl-CoA dehydratase subunit BcrC/BadD/HgdB